MYKTDELILKQKFEFYLKKYYEIINLFNINLFSIHNFNLIL